MEDSSPIIKKPTVDLSRFQVEKGHHGSYRGDMLEKFLARVNLGRQESGYPPFTMKRLAFMLSHVPTWQLEPFWRECERARCFSAFFFWSLKAQNGAKKEPDNPAQPS